MKVRTASLALALLASSLAHAIDDSAFARCRGIADTANRLACYDALPMNVTPAATQAPSPMIAWAALGLSVVSLGLALRRPDPSRGA